MTLIIYGLIFAIGLALLWQGYKKVYEWREMRKYRKTLKEKTMNKDEIEGAEKLRAELLKSVAIIFIPHIEGVFAVFAKQNGFKPRDILDGILADKNAAQENIEGE